MALALGQMKTDAAGCAKRLKPNESVWGRHTGLEIIPEVGGVRLRRHRLSATWGAGGSLFPKRAVVP